MDLVAHPHIAQAGSRVEITDENGQVIQLQPVTRRFQPEGPQVVSGSGKVVQAGQLSQVQHRVRQSGIFNRFARAGMDPAVVSAHQAGGDLAILPDFQVFNTVAVQCCDGQVGVLPLQLAVDGQAHERGQGQQEPVAADDRTHARLRRQPVNRPRVTSNSGRPNMNRLARVAVRAGCQRHC